MAPILSNDPLRALKGSRLEDLLAAAGAVPLPAGPTASPLPNPEADAQPGADQTPPTPASDPAHADPAPMSERGPLAPHAWSDQDSVQKSLQAALDVIRHSLHDDASPNREPGLAEHGAPLAETHAQPADTAGPLVPDTPASSALADQTLHGGDAAVAPVVSDAGLLPPALQTALSEVAGVTSLAADLPGTLIQSTIGAIDAVTIPSLGGVGFDAMAGLLHPAVASPVMALAADPIHGLAGDIPIFDAIGAPQLGNADHELAQLAHTPAHQIGSGLI